MIDTHAHLDFPDFDADREGVLARAMQAGVREIISIGTRLDTSASAVELATRYPGAGTPALPAVWATVGIHPGEADSVDPADGAWLAEIRRLAAHPRVVAIGEIGLDYHRLPSAKIGGAAGSSSSAETAERLEAPAAGEPAPAPSAEELDAAYKARQAEVFRKQLDLAVELGLSVVIHQRDSWDDTLAILREPEYRGRVRGVFHCFGGTPEQARELREEGHLVSFTGIVTFKNARQVHATARSVPDGSFMLETDCPYLAPVPHRGKRCEPAHTALTAEFIANARGVPLEELIASTTRTAREFFAFQRGA